MKSLRGMSANVPIKTEGVFMDEFGKRCPSENAAAFLFEHCKPICEKNAVEILASLC